MLSEEGENVGKYSMVLWKLEISSELRLCFPRAAGGVNVYVSLEPEELSDEVLIGREVLSKLKAQRDPHDEAPRLQNPHFAASTGTSS